MDQGIATTCLLSGHRPTPRLTRPGAITVPFGHCTALSGDALTKAARRSEIMYPFPMQHLIHPQEIIGTHLLFSQKLNETVCDHRRTLISYVTPRDSTQTHSPFNLGSLEHIQGSIQRTQSTVACL